MLIFLICLVVAARAGSLLGQGPERVAGHLYRLEGTDAASGIHYLRLIALRPQTDGSQEEPAAAPRFVVECRERSGKRSLHWFVRFDGSPDFAFQPPFVPTSTSLFPPANPSVELKMHFEGYMKSQEFKRQWEVLPTGELRYRNSGMNSPNLDDPRYFLRWLSSLPNLRLAYAKPVAGLPKELVFPLKPLLAFMDESPVCQP